MYGEYRHTLDTKSRTFLPSKLREQLGDDIVLTIVSDKCISVYSREKWNEFEEKLKRLPQISAAAVLRRIYSCTFETTIDVQGRIMIPQNLRVKAELSKNIVSVGVGARGYKRCRRCCKAYRARNVSNVRIFSLFRFA